MTATPARAQLQLLHAFSTFGLGGPQARFVQLANAFGPDYRHLVMAMDGCFEAGERLGPQVQWTPLRIDVRKGSALANRGVFRAALRRLQPDLLLSYNWGAIEWAAANIPRLCAQVHVEDGFGPEEAQQQLPRRVLMRRVLLGGHRVPVLVPSRQLQTLAVNTWKLPAQRVHFVPNGVRLPDLQTSAARASWPAGEGVEDRVLCVGTLAGLRPEKNLARLVRAFAQLHAQQPARLVIVGDGPQRAELQALADTLGVAHAVQFTGYLSNPAQALMGFDLFALSSDTEQLPMALLEAMAAGVPVVATAVGDVPEVLQGVSPGNLAEPDDAAFAAALLRAAAQPERWALWAAAGRERVQTAYGEAQMLAQWCQVFDGALNQGRTVQQPEAGGTHQVGMS